MGVAVPERPGDHQFGRLRVVGQAPKFSALPHSVIRHTSLSRDARLLVAVLMMYDWQGSECTASHTTLAADMGCSVRMLRAYLNELIRAGIIIERDFGVRRQKVYTLCSIGTVLPIETPASEQPASDCGPVNEKQASDSTAVNRKFSTGQSEISDTFNRKQASDSKKKTTKKKTTEEDKRKRSTERLPKPPTPGGQVIDLVKAGGAPAPTFTGRDGKALRESGADPALVAAAYLAAWRGEWDPGGNGFLRENLSVHAVVDRLAGFQAEQARQPVQTEQASGAASKLAPATDADRALWAVALADLARDMTASNVASYLEPLEVAGRAVDGGLWLVVPAGVGSMIGRFRPAIVRALHDAGDANAAAVAFKVRRRTQEADHAE